MSQNKIIVALDSSNLKEIIRLTRLLKEEVHAFKIGYEFFLHYGIEGYNKVKKICPKIFLDLKLHDIPNTIKGGIRAVQKFEPLFTTIHITGGDDMMKASLNKNKKTKILGVSILTSLNSKQTRKYYNEKNIISLVKKFAKSAKRNKLDGIVCSPKEIKYIRKEVGKNFIIVTPGIRLESKIKMDDQKRTETPRKAINMGANFLVIGRPITKSKDPLKTLKKINKSLD